MFYKDSLKWSAQYDVIVIGFGGAGAGAARFAADQNAKVLLIDAAPEGSEGGNTRFAGGAIAYGTDFNALKTYYLQTYAPFNVDEDTLDTFIKNVMATKIYTKKFFNIEAQPTGRRPQGEYPEYQHSDAMQSQTMTKGLYNGGFWKLLRQQVYQRLNKIDVWYESPAEHLIQDPMTKTVVGVQIKRKGKLWNIAAKNGVVMSLGGFENNSEMVQTFLGQGALAPIGTLYNQGKGIDFAIEVGARLWHMHNYDSHGLSLNEGKKHERFAYMINWKSLFTGSLFIAGDDGTRYYKEDEEDRHGYKYNHGDWIMLPNQDHPHIVFDQTQYKKLQHDTSKQATQIKEMLSCAIKADTITELAQKIKAPKLLQAVSDFNFMVTQKHDYALNRDIKTMRAFDDGPYYAISVRHNILHTHGGARRNSKTEVLDLDGRIIPHLYEAGELGDLFATKYIGANSIADLLISGRIAGENAATPKNDHFDFKVDAVTSASRGHITNPDLKTDAQISAKSFQAGPDQFIGISNQGLGDLPIVVRISVDHKTQRITNIETLQQNETTTVGGKAIPVLIKEMLAKNTFEVDAVSGASSTSQGFKAAVKDAMNKLRKA